MPERKDHTMCSIMAAYKSTITTEELTQALIKTASRGPDDRQVLAAGDVILGFERLSIMGPGAAGMQPFTQNGNYAVCNGELYGFEKTREVLKEKGYTFAGDSDCEIILPLYEQYGTEMFEKLDAEFACVIFDAKNEKLVAARDPIGIRPLFYGFDKGGGILFASEAKNLVGLTDKICPFPPGHFMEVSQGRKMPEEGGDKVSISIHAYMDLAKRVPYLPDGVEEIAKNIHDKLVEGVRKRLIADAPVGFLLSGGLDSSLVCAIAAKLSKEKIRTFAIGMDVDAIDLKYARKVADFIGSEHTEVIIDKKTVIEALPEVVAALGTYDITTIRASIGMYLVCKAIREKTDIRVLLTGEISDEIFGYKYTDYAPDAESFQAEAEKRLRELYMYDVLRADRCISVHSMEARVPFGDIDFVKYVMAVDPAKKMNTYGQGKYLLRHAFEGDCILPEDILFREKAAFSDAVGHSMVDDLKEYADSCYSDAEYDRKRRQYKHAAPFTKESLLYRELFEKYYPGQAEMIADFWMPNRDWDNCDVDDPSARVLKNYGASGI